MPSALAFVFTLLFQKFREIGEGVVKLQKIWMHAVFDVYVVFHMH
jgi:hypothetical protein